ncbi:GNAT family N-acetyltransferase [Romboutsia sp. 1001713B170207_170306_H8]|uniref:GNAT family N-acetyltransferase n=1 Tax=Romboutsia sp. 1001713B170207_170306_H8 TaxID=2787112 RepID=UPI0008215F63|nr:GNAT family protein [Romboutsia sp. 1001713B170207_170306_H8]SCH43875.1 Putative ribosomal N-acetyltransferase YdaF [uncultured Clostridium sp.]
MGRKYSLILSQYKNLYTSRMKLRPFSMEDRKDVFEFAGDEEATKFVTWEAHKSIDQSANSILNYYSRGGVYAIELKENKKCIGCFDIRIDSENDKASFGYILNRQYWNKGYMTEVLDLMLKLCFDVLKLNRVEAEHYTENPGSGRVMQKCNMKFEGRGIQEVKVKGIYHDIDHYAILKSDWIKYNTEKDVVN